MLVNRFLYAGSSFYGWRRQKLMKKALEALVDVVFILVVLVTGIYFLTDVFGLLGLGRDFRMAVVRLFFVGAPLSFFVSLIAFVSTGRVRYKWYLGVSGLEVLIILLLFWIIYSGQI